MHAAGHVDSTKKKALKCSRSVLHAVGRLANYGASCSCIYVAMNAPAQHTHTQEPVRHGAAAGHWPSFKIASELYTL